MNNKPKNTGLKYEKHIYDLIEEIVIAVFDDSYKNLKFKHNARLKGTLKSEYQIDILGYTDNEFFIIECKDHAGEVDYKITASFIYKCIDISKFYPSKNIYIVIIDKSGFRPSAVTTKHKKVWNSPLINLVERVKFLKIGAKLIDDSIVIYEFDKDNINFVPLLFEKSLNFNFEQEFNYLKTGSDFGKRISSGFRILSNLNQSFYGRNGVREEVEVTCYENISNSFLHLREYFDALYFSEQILKSNSTIKKTSTLHEAQLIKTIATYKKLQVDGRLHKRPGFYEIKKIEKLVESDVLNLTQQASSMLFLGLWLARYDNFYLGVKYINKSKELSELKNFRDNRWHYFGCLMRLGELDTDNEKAFYWLEQAKKHLKELCNKHRSVGIEYLQRITEHRQKMI